MDSMSAMLILLLTCILIKLILHSLHPRSTKANYNLPPGPSFLTIVLSIVELGKKPQQTLANLAKVHGPMIMHFKLGQLTTIVISSPEIAKLVLQTHDVLLSDDRTIPQAVCVHNDHEQCCLPFLPVSPLWRDLRKICYNLIFSKNSLDASQGLRQKKLQEFLSDVHKYSLNGEPIDIGKLAFKISINYLSNVLFSLDFVQSIGEVDECNDMVLYLAKAISTPNLGDFFPTLKKVDPQGIRRHTATCVSKLLQIFDGYIDQRLKQREEENYVTKYDMLDTLLNISQENSHTMDKEKIKHLFLDLVVAGTDTTSYTSERAMTELLHHPDTMFKAKRELQQTIGIGNPIEESHIEKLPYLQPIIKETLRMHPRVPFLLPRKAKANVEMLDYIVPKDAQIIINEWAIFRSPNIWDDPNLFSPGRFLGSKIDFKGYDFWFTPFGSERRICPGLALATRLLHLMLGSLINSFDWKHENGIRVEDMD